MGDLTDPEVILTIRPNRLSIIGSTTALINSKAASMLASSAVIQVSLVQSRKSPGGGPPALFTRMSTWPAASSTAARPSMSVANARSGIGEGFRRAGVHHQIGPDCGKCICTAKAKPLVGSAHDSGLPGYTKIKHSILLGF